MIVRLFKSIEFWDEEKIDELPLCAISSWSSVKDNDCSVFALPSLEKKEYRWIVLRALAENFSAWCDGVDLFIIEDDGIGDMELDITPDKSQRLNCLHENISNINYQQFKKLVSYTYDNKNNYLSCPPVEIRKIIKDLTNDEFTLFVKYHCDYADKGNKGEKPEKFVKRIMNAYFENNIEECPIFIKS